MTIGIIGLGGGGGNMADEAAKNGFQTGAINFSQQDLDSLENVRYKLKVMGTEGAGKDRQLAQALVREHHEMIVDFFRENFSNPSIEVIVFPFSTSGGSGSGMAATVMDIASSIFPEKKICGGAIMPDKSEVTGSQSNCLEAFEELSQYNFCIFPIDNNQLFIQNSYIGQSKLYKRTNEAFIHLLKKISSYTTKNSKNGNFDKKDFLTILDQKGIAIMAEADITSIQSNISPEGIAIKVQESWENSIFAPIEYQSVIKAGVIFDGQESLMENLDYDLIFKKFKHGTPIQMFQGNYHESNGKILTILTGLRWCNRRLSEIDELLTNDESKLAKIFSEEDAYTPKSKGISSLLKNSDSGKPKPLSEVLGKWRR